MVDWAELDKARREYEGLKDQVDQTKEERLLARQQKIWQAQQEEIELYQHAFQKAKEQMQNDSALLKDLESLEWPLDDYIHTVMQRPAERDATMREMVKKNQKEYLVRFRQRAGVPLYNPEKALEESKELKKRVRSDPDYSSDRYLHDLVKKHTKGML